jgi:hypothetical protein
VVAVCYADLSSEISFHFVTTQNPESVKDPKTRRQIRSHAVKHALQGKRKLEREANDNFRVLSSSSVKIVEQKETQLVQTLLPRTRLSSSVAGKLNPFEALAIDSSRLKALLNHRKFYQTTKNSRERQKLSPTDATCEAAEPVFSVADNVAFQTFPLVFRTDRDDPALLNAIMLTFAFAMTGGIMNRECISYQSLAMSFIRKTISSPDRPVSVATLGAILLLAGVEVCMIWFFHDSKSLLLYKANIIYVGSFGNAISGSATHDCDWSAA